LRQAGSCLSRGWRHFHRGEGDDQFSSQRATGNGLSSTA
jgi:hypothetical protein